MRQLRNNHVMESRMQHCLYTVGRRTYCIHGFDKNKTVQKKENIYRYISPLLLQYQRLMTCLTALGGKSKTLEKLNEKPSAPLILVHSLV